MQTSIGKLKLWWLRMQRAFKLSLERLAMFAKKLTKCMDNSKFFLNNPFANFSIRLNSSLSSMHASHGKKSKKGWKWCVLKVSKQENVPAVILNTLLC